MDDTDNETTAEMAHKESDNPNPDTSGEITAHLMINAQILNNVQNISQRLNKIEHTQCKKTSYLT